MVKAVRIRIVSQNSNYMISINCMKNYENSDLHLYLIILKILFDYIDLTCTKFYDLPLNLKSIKNNGRKPICTKVMSYNLFIPSNYSNKLAIDNI